MPRLTLHTQNPREWALASRREMQMAIGQQLPDECKLPQELPPELSARRSLIGVSAKSAIRHACSSS